MPQNNAVSRRLCEPSAYSIKPSAARKLIINLLILTCIPNCSTSANCVWRRYFNCHAKADQNPLRFIRRNTTTRFLTGIKRKSLKSAKNYFTSIITLLKNFCLSLTETTKICPTPRCLHGSCRKISSRQYNGQRHHGVNFLSDISGRL